MCFKKIYTTKAIVLIVLVGLIIGLIYTVNRYEKYTIEKFIIIISSYGVVLFFLQHALRSWDKKKIDNLCLVILSSIFSIYSAEVMVGIFVGEPLNQLKAAKKNNVKFEPRLPAQFAKYLRENNPKVFLTLYKPDGFKNDSEGNVILPLAGISRKTIVHCNESGDYAIFESDEYGFNNPAGSHESSPDILLVGDSFTLGACVNPDKDTAGILRSKGHSVVNLGVGGTGPLFALAVLREYANDLRPPLVFWLYFEGNDILDLIKESKDSFLIKYLNPDFTQSLKNKQNEIDEFISNYILRYLNGVGPQKIKPFYKKVVELSHLRKHMKILLNLSEEPPPPSDFLLQVAQKMKLEVESWGGKMTVVYLPAIARYRNGNPDSGELFHRDKVLLVFDSLDLPVIDLHPIFMKQDDPTALFPLGIGPHYSEDGYFLVGEAISKFIDSYDK
ncbi:MAG: hypothetical protein Q7U10_00270 [Thermodesulfovibrionia bacterium]|nr:hypothetical protein [Thermodesulfovibrionia bacterium]